MSKTWSANERLHDNSGIATSSAISQCGLPGSTIDMDQHCPAQSSQRYDARPFSEHTRSSRPCDRHYRDRLSSDHFNPDDDRVYCYRSRSRHGDSRPPYQSDSTSRYGREGHIDVTLPKNFPKPLTCFFWANNGRCSKRDHDCAYAHWDTGHLAGSPITVSAKDGICSVAGKKARELASDTYRPSSSNKMESREAALLIREEELDRREKKLGAVEALSEELALAKQELEARGRKLIKLEASMRVNTVPAAWACEKCGENNTLGRDLLG